MDGRSEQAPAASVVIPVHDAADVVGDQMSALCAQTGIDDVEVVAVLNRCTDRSAQVIESFADRLDLRIVTADGLASAAYARNTGAGAARSDRVLFCDADDRVSPTWVRELTDALDGADFVGGRITVDRDGLADWAHRYFYADKEAGLLVREGRIPYPISASMGIRKEALTAVDGFDESFKGASGEETDLAIRLVRAGFRVGFVDGAVLRYRPRTGFRELSRQQRARAFSNSRLSLREGVDIRRPSIALQAFRTIRRLGRRVLLERTVHPLALASDVVVNVARYRAAVWASTASEPLYDEDRDVVDVVAVLGTPLIGGLAFRTDRSAVGAVEAPDGSRRTVLALLDQVAEPGDTVVDLAAGLGHVAVAAARVVGPTGHVRACEPDARTGLLLRSNLSRHGSRNVEVVDRMGPDRAAALHELLRGDEPAMVVCEIAPSTPDGGRWVVEGCRDRGLRVRRIERSSAVDDGRVRVLDPDRADAGNGRVGGWLIGVPAARNDAMVAAVAGIFGGAAEHPAADSSAERTARSSR